MSVYTAFRCPKELHTWLKKAAKAENRTVSNYLVWFLEREKKNAEQGVYSVLPHELGQVIKDKARKK